MFRVFATIVALGLCLMLISSPARAVVVYDSGYTYAGYHASDTRIQAYGADDFSLAGANTLNGIQFRGLYASSNTPVTDSFTITFYNSAGNVPGTALGSTTLSSLSRTDTGANAVGNYDIYLYDAAFTTPIALSGGTTYWVSIANATPAGGDFWYWSYTGTDNDYADKVGNTQPWVPGTGQGFNFVLSAIPEPSSLALLALGGLLAGRRRR